MRKVWALFLTFSLAAGCFASVTAEAPPLKASTILIPVGIKGQQISLLELSRIKASEWEALTGQHLKWMDKVAFRLAQRALRKGGYHDGSFTAKKLEQLAGKVANPSSFHFGGFMLGFFLGWVGVLIAYLVRGENTKRRVKWAWIGFAISSVLILLYILLFPLSFFGLWIA